MLELRGARDNDANPTPDAPTLTEQSTDTAPKVALYGEVPTVAGVGSGAGYAAMASRPAGFQQFHLHQQHQMALANQAAMLHSGSSGVAPEQFAAWAEQYGAAAAAAMAAQEQWKLATAMGSWPMQQPHMPFAPPPAPHIPPAACVNQMAMGATPLLPLPVRCTPVAPSAGAVTRPRASSVSDSAMAQGELARSLRRAGKATVGERSLPAVSDSGSRAPADDAECDGAYHKGCDGTGTVFGSNSSSALAGLLLERDDLSRDTSGAPAAATAAGLPSKRKRSSSHSAVSKQMTDREKDRVSSHVATEQRRRDRINESFRVLRLIVPHSEKTDKASFLGEVTAYIRKLQRLVASPGVGGQKLGGDSIIADVGTSASVAKGGCE